MAAIANMVAADSAAATHTFVAKVPSAGDKSPAKWIEDAASAIVGHRPSATMETRDNGARTGRYFEFQTKHPIIETVGGVATVVATVILTTSGTVPTTADSVKTKNAVYVHNNLLGLSVVKDGIADGYAPT